MTLALAVLAAPVAAGPGYDQGRHELEWVMDRLIEWLPGQWNSYPQVWFERNVRPATSEREHEYWHRTFARIDAPHIGEVVFYGQINVHGPDGPVLAGSQVLYHAYVDESLGAVNVLGQGPADPDAFIDLHRKPKLWRSVKMRDPDALNCDWLWRRDGQQLFGVLQGKTADKQKYGPGTCSFISKRTDAEFKADAEWVLTPDELWLYDNNYSGGFLFLGRPDRTHTRLYRVREYDCHLVDSKGERRVVAHDRGYTEEVRAEDGRILEMTLLRAEFPDADRGLMDELRLTLSEPGATEPAFVQRFAPRAPQVNVENDPIKITCERAGI